MDGGATNVTYQDRSVRSDLNRLGARSCKNASLRLRGQVNDCYLGVATPIAGEEVLAVRRDRHVLQTWESANRYGIRAAGECRGLQVNNPNLDPEEIANVSFGVVR